MKVELSDRYARTVLRSLKDREEALADDIRHYKGCDIGDAIAQELDEIRIIKGFLEAKLLEE